MSIEHLEQIIAHTGEFTGPCGEETTSYGHFYIVPSSNGFGVIANHGGFASGKFGVGELYMGYGFPTKEAAMATVELILAEIQTSTGDTDIYIA